MSLGAPWAGGTARESLLQRFHTKQEEASQGGKSGMWYRTGGR